MKEREEMGKGEEKEKMGGREGKGRKEGEEMKARVCLRSGLLVVPLLRSGPNLVKVRTLHRLRWKCNCSCVPSGLRNKPVKFYKIS